MTNSSSNQLANNASNNSNSTSQNTSTTGLIAISSYFFASIAMTLVNKSLFEKYEFRGNLSLIFLQNVITLFGLHIFRSFRLMEYEELEKSKMKVWAPLTILFLLMLITGSYALRFLPVPIVVVFKNITTVFIAFGDWYIYGDQVDGSTLFAIIAMIVSAIVAAWYDLSVDSGISQFESAHVVGYVWIVLNCIVSAGYPLYLKYVTKRLRLSDLGKVNYNMSLSSIALIMISPFSVGYSLFSKDAVQPMQSVHTYTTMDNVAFVLLMLTSGVVGFILSWTTFWSIRLTSPTIYAMAGSFNKIFVTAAGFLLFKYSLSVGGHIAVWVGLAAAVYFTASKAWGARASKPGGNLLPV